MMAPPVMLILGAGPGIGEHVASAFSKKGYNVALASRSRIDRLVDERRLEFHLDLAHPDSVADVFDRVKDRWGPPNVVVYNGAARTLVDPKDPLSSMSIEDFYRDMNVNLLSTVMAARASVQAFKELPPSANRTFIFTGNKLNVMSWPFVLPFAMAKTGVAHMIWDCAVAYRDQGIKFYYPDERREDGAPVKEDIDPVAAAELYPKLAEDKEQGPWHYTFIKGQGYRSFASIDRPWNLDLQPEQTT